MKSCLLGHSNYASSDELLCTPGTGTGEMLEKKKEPVEKWKDLTKTLKCIEAMWYDGKGTRLSVQIPRNLEVRSL